MAKLLKDNGSIVISLPHVGHAVIAGCLRDGDFQYGEWGLLDRTHIRFFGIKNIQNLVEDANLKLIDAKFVVRSPEQTEFAERWLRLPEGFKKEILSNPFSFVYQVVLHVVPQNFEAEPIQLSTVPVSFDGISLNVLNRTYGLTGHFRKIMLRLLSQEQKSKLKSYLRKRGFNV